LACARRDRDLDARSLRWAADEAGTRGLALFQAAAQIVAGEVCNDAAAGATGKRWMAERGVRAPAALARMLVPTAGGRWS
jgi:hypothetical protein